MMMTLLKRMSCSPTPIVLAAVMAAVAVSGAHASPQLDELNRDYASVAQEDRADLVLLPTLASMDAPPTSASSVIKAAFLTPDAAGWSAASQWATADPQVEALDALKKITERRSPYVFAQPYGDGAASDARASGLYVDLGNPEMIVAASFGYFGALDRLEALVQIEATRLADEGDGVGAIDLLTRWMRFARVFADREYFVEKQKAFEWMRFTLVRMRDIAWLYPDLMDAVEMRAAIRSLADRELNLSRLRMPNADRLAAEELLEQTFIPRGGPNPDTFGPTLAAMESRDRPLQLFTEAARWRKVASFHADYFDTRDEIQAIFNDWELRWSVKPHDVLLEQPIEYDKLDDGRYALIKAAVPNVGELFDERLALRIQLGGTRLALAVVGYKQWSGSWPDPVFAIRPRFVSEIDVDPWDPDEKKPFRFFVPMRDVPQSERVDPKPHVIQVVGDAIEGAEPEASGPPDADEIYAWAEKSAQITPPGSKVSPQFVGQMARSLPKNIPDKMRDQMRTQMLKGMQSVSDPMPDWLYQLAGDDPARGVDLKEVVVDATMRIMFSPAYRSALLELAKRPTLSIEDLRHTFAEVAAEILKESGGGAAPAIATGGGGRLFAVPTFTVTLDQSAFVLYSVGPDGKPERAEKVGPGGTDILIWPPMLSLVRDHLRSR